MITKIDRGRPVVWNKLQDDVLKVFGAKDSIRSATMAINEEFRSWGYHKPDALVISDESVMSPENSSGCVHVDELNSWHACVAFNEDGKNRSVADRLTCAMAILGAHQSGTDDGGEEQLRKAQLVVTELLLEHPVLLHPRLVIPFRVSEVAHLSVFKALIKTGIGQLPSILHGVDPAKIHTFAQSALLMAPIKVKEPRYAYSPNSMLGLNRIQLDYAGNPFQWARASISPEFMASMMEIGRHCPGFGWPGTQAFDFTNNISSIFILALPRALGLYKKTSKSGDIQRERICEQLLNEAVLDKRIESDQVRNTLLRHLQVNTIQTSGSSPSIADGELPQWAVAKNTTLILEMLERLGLAKNLKDAAEWLHLQFLGGGTNKHQKPAWASMPSAMGFLESLTETGFKLPESPPSNADLMARGVGNEYWYTLSSNFDTWKTAHEIVGRTRAMESVLKAAASAAAACDDPRGIKPNRLRRGMLV